MNTVNTDIICRNLQLGKIKFIKATKYNESLHNHNRFIVLIKDPIERNFNAFITNKNHEKIFKEGRFSELAEEFARTYNHHIPDHWLKNELGRFISIDEIDFDVGNGYKLVETQDKSFLIVRYDKIKENVKMIGKFLGTTRLKLLFGGSHLQKMIFEKARTFFTDELNTIYKQSTYFNRFFSGSPKIGVGLPTESVKPQIRGSRVPKVSSVPRVRRAAKLPKILVILGNGPSLKGINFDLFKNDSVHTFGLNMAFRKYKELNFQPTYFGCFDYVVCKNKLKEFSALVKEWKTTEFFFVNTDYSNNKEPIFPPDISNLANFIKINHIYKHHVKGGAVIDQIATNFSRFLDCGNSGANATQVGLIKRAYKKILLIGCDANYTEIINGAVKFEMNGTTRLKIANTPKKNTNYWFDDYQQTGDVYNIPQCQRWHRDEWNRLAQLYKKFYPACEIINCSPISTINGFRKSTIHQELIDMFHKARLPIDIEYSEELALSILRKERIPDYRTYCLRECIEGMNIIQLRDRLIEKVKSYDENFSEIPNSQKTYLKRMPENIEQYFLDNPPAINNFDGRFITFIMPIKNRSRRGRISVETVVNEHNAKHCNFMIIEDSGRDMLTLDDFKYSYLIDHHIVNTGVAWTRAGLLNYGTKIATTPLILYWDADFLFDNDFVDKLRAACCKIDFSKYIFAINLFETHTVQCQRRNYYRFAEPYSHIWIHSLDHLKTIGGFNESLTGHGYEENDLNNRLIKKFDVEILHSGYIFRDIVGCHYSHDDNLRGKLKTLENRKMSVTNINGGNLVQENWGECQLVRQPVYTKIG